MQIDATIKFNMGASPTLEDLRSFVDVTSGFSETTPLRFEVVRGQRDSETITIHVDGSTLLHR